jgi:hypothetical protein
MKNWCVAGGPHPNPLPHRASKDARLLTGYAGEGARSLLPLAGEGGAKRRMSHPAPPPAVLSQAAPQALASSRTRRM